MSTDFDGVIAAWDADARAGGRRIHPFDPESDEFWALGREQAQQVRSYAEPGAFVVDFGAGIGRLAIPLVELGFDVLAVDSSPAMLDALAERAAAAGVEVPTVQSDGDGLADLIADIADRPVDVVVARAVLIHHDYAGVERIVTALAGALRPGGHLIADWPLGGTGERRDWIDVTTWRPVHRLNVARTAGLEPVVSTEPSVWRKA